MTSKNGLKLPKIRVMMEDGAEWEVQSAGKDQIRWEETAARNKWPEGTKTPQKWATFLAWRASMREGHIPTSMTWEAFVDAHYYVGAIQDEEDEEPTDVPPTVSAADTG